MATVQQVEEMLDQVIVPTVLRNVRDMNLLRSVEISGGQVTVVLADTALAPDAREWLQKDVEEKLRVLDGVDTVTVSFQSLPPPTVNRIDRAIAVMSGKGGVGKSVVSALLALAIAGEGKRVGILDADVTGPSIPKMFGITWRPSGSESALLPVTSKTGIEIMSINLLLPNEDEAVIWRGPLISQSIQQFYEGVLWGKLDYLVIDLPPGTGDVPLTVMQHIPLTGVIVTFTPQSLTTMVVRKAVKMAQQLNVPILGIVENMSYFSVPETGIKIEVFGESKAAMMAKAVSAPILGRLPLDPELAKLCDQGLIETYDSEAFRNFREAVIRVLGAVPRT